MRFEVRWCDAESIAHVASFPDRATARRFAQGVTGEGYPWTAYEVRPIDFEDYDDGYEGQPVAAAEPQKPASPAGRRDRVR